MKHLDDLSKLGRYWISNHRGQASSSCPMRIDYCDLRFDYSNSLIDGSVIKKLFSFLNQSDFESKRANFFAAI